MVKSRCDVCGEIKEEWETHNYHSGLHRCKKDCSSNLNKTKEEVI